MSPLGRFIFVSGIIVSVLAGGVGLWVVLNPGGCGCTPRLDRVKSDFANILTAAAMYKEDHRQWPETLEALMNPPETGSGESHCYLDREPLDPWSDELYVYMKKPGEPPILISWGADLVPGGEGIDADITSRDVESRR